MTETPDRAAYDQKAVAFLQKANLRIRAEMAKVIIGQEEVIEQLLIAILAKGHCLLEGVPGIAKTLLIQTLARTLKLEYRRIQFTPDLMPADITGTEVLSEDPVTKERTFRFIPGPIFTNILLADEINRTPPKTQAALLEVMQERRVTVGGKDHDVGNPFFVLATQNPIEQEGTYSLPEAQLDRFLFKITVSYPADQEELEIMRRVASPAMAQGQASVLAVLGGDEIRALQELVLRVPVSEHILQVIHRMVRCTRPGAADQPKAVRDWISWGASPRASIYLVIASKARAILHGRSHVAPEDVLAMAKPVLRHRLNVNYAAQAEGITSDRIVDELIASIPKDRKVDSLVTK
jgi:MoxR-like ATPase